MSETELINISDYDGQYTYIGRGSPFGNPFKLKEHGGQYTRKESVKKYRTYFYERIEERDTFRKKVEGLKGETLGCYCYPEACHGDVILEYLEGEPWDRAINTKSIFDY